MSYYSEGSTAGSSQSADVTEAILKAFVCVLKKIAGDGVAVVKCVSVNEKSPSNTSSVVFHKNIVVSSVDVGGLSDGLKDYVRLWTQQYGVLCFLYSCVLTRGLDNVVADLSGGDENLIDKTFGHGNQSLVNLLLAGNATPNVFDYSRNVSGLELHGVQETTEIGFLSILEALRYLKVGEFLKCPKHPIWILGSESHLTVLFSRDTSLSTSDDTPYKRARAAFDQLDVEGNGFIPTTDLPSLLSKLEMVSDPEYISIMAEQLDPENMGIILFNSFVQEFFPKALNDENFIQKEFDVFHYNGLIQSNSDRKVCFRQGKAIIYMEYNHAPDAGTAPSPLLRVLRTKWPTIEINWDFVPSIV